MPKIIKISLKYCLKIAGRRPKIKIKNQKSKLVRKNFYYILWVFFEAEFSSSDLADFWGF